MQVDTRADISIIAETTQQNLFPNAPLQQSSIQLQTYTTESPAVLGTMEVQVEYSNYVGKHVLFVVSENGPTLLEETGSWKLGWTGRTWGGYCAKHFSYLEISVTQILQCLQERPGHIKMIQG